MQRVECQGRKRRANANTKCQGKWGQGHHWGWMKQSCYGGCWRALWTSNSGLKVNAKNECQGRMQTPNANEIEVKATTGAVLQNFVPQVVAFNLSLPGHFTIYKLYTMDLWWIKACGNETVLLWRLLTSLVDPPVVALRWMPRSNAKTWMPRAIA